MLPMILPMISQANIAAKRINIFLKLPESDDYISKAANAENKVTLKKSSFRWANAVDKFVPPILDPYF